MKENLYVQFLSEVGYRNLPCSNAVHHMHISVMESTLLSETVLSMETQPHNQIYNLSNFYEYFYVYVLSVLFINIFVNPFTDK